MKHFFYFIFLFLICSCNGYKQLNETIEEEKPFKIDGKIDDENIEPFVFKYYSYVKENSVIDTISVINGTFTIEGTICPRTLARLYINDTILDIYMDPGEMQLYLKKDSLGSYVLKGSKTNDDKVLLETQTKPLEDYLSKIETQLSSEQNKVFLISQKDSINNLLENVRIDFISSHPSSYYSLDVIFELYSTKKQNGDVLKSLFDGLSVNVRVSNSGQEIYSLILQREKSTMTNVSSLEALDKDGTLIKLSDFEGQYIFIDFWASWCVPCINGFPHLRELYAKYKDKGLVVINISMDSKRDEQKWLDAIEKNGITEWIHILSCKNKGENNICDLHETGPIPHYILIDRSGNKIAQWIGFGSDVAKEQDAMFENIFLGAVTHL
ncbi:thiol:disulfide interchange protein [Bacteroidia bacterium]|nr:thiol:disulfide interchange protein [Bacteroidia bacterium]GHV70167.1 thiol:disulfide interchange protein [Bacteroidia bacterium]